jgi:hypothetical protein
MRLVVLLPVLICVAAPAYAEGARENRYGPTTPRQQAAAVAVATAHYDGPMLGWANKRQPQAEVSAPVEPVPTRPAPLANWAGYQGAPATPPPPPAAIAPAPAPAPPSCLYAAPRPAPIAAIQTAPAPVKDWSNYRSARVMTSPASALAPAAAPPANLYAQPIARQAIAAPPPVQPRQVATANTGATGARYYSVSREYGLAPDALPPAGPDSRVLITATEPPPEARDAVPMHGSADWLAAGARGEEDEDDSAARRVKARNQAQ